MTTGLKAIVSSVGFFFFLVSPWSAAAQVIEIQTGPKIARLFEKQFGDWRMDGPVQAFLPAELAAYDPERGALIREYGLRETGFADYVHADRATVRVEVFQAINYVSAYGMYSSERTTTVRVDGLGAESTLSDDQIAFWKGEYYVRLSFGKDVSGRRAAAGKMTELAKAIAHKLPGGAHETPVLIQHLPTEGLIAGTERFIAGRRGLAKFPGYDNPNDVLQLESDGVEAAIADCQTGGEKSRLLLVEYHTPQLAKSAYDRVTGYFQSLPESERERRILKREGNYIVQMFDVTDRAMAEKIVAEIKYTAKVRWLKDDQIRVVQGFPEFPAVDWLLSTFAFLGFLVLAVIGAGIVFGYSFFVWRRRRASRFGFSDAGGMLRLNLDQIALPSPETPQRSLPKGE